MSRPVRAVGMLAGAAILTAMLAAPGASATPTTWYVGPGVTAAGVSSCASPDFATLQAAVDAAGRRDTILVCPGTYDEAVIIDGATRNGLTIRAVQRWRATLRPQAPLAGYLAGIRVDDTRRVRISGLRILTRTGATSCQFADYGIRLNAGAAGAVIRGNRIRAAGPGTFAGPCGLSVGISVADGASAWIGYNLIEDFRLKGIEVAGTGSTADILNNSIRYRHAAAPGADSAQAEAIDIHTGALATIKRNRMVGLDTAVIFLGAAPPLGTPTLRYGVRVHQAADGVVVRRNLVHHAYRGIKVTASDRVKVQTNTVDRVRDTGIRIVDSRSGRIEGNTVHEAGRYGISVEGTSADNLIDRNDVRGALDFDCFDTTSGSGSGGTANDYGTANLALDESPAGICLPV